MMPWFERPIIYDVRAQPNIVQSTSGSRDLQMVRARTRLSRCQTYNQQSCGASCVLWAFLRVPSSFSGATGEHQPARAHAPPS